MTTYDNSEPQPDWAPDCRCGCCHTCLPTPAVMTLPAAEFDRLMEELERPPRVNYHLRATAERRDLIPFAHRSVAGVGEN